MILNSEVRLFKTFIYTDANRRFSEVPRIRSSSGQVKSGLNSKSTLVERSKYNKIQSLDLEIGGSL